MRCASTALAAAAEGWLPMPATKYQSSSDCAEWRQRRQTLNEADVDAADFADVAPTTRAQCDRSASAARAATPIPVPMTWKLEMSLVLQVTVAIALTLAMAMAKGEAAALVRRAARA